MEGRDAAKHAATHRTAPHRKNGWAPSVGVAGIEEPCSVASPFFCTPPVFRRKFCSTVIVCFLFVILSCLLRVTSLLQWDLGCPPRTSASYSSHQNLRSLFLNLFFPAQLSPEISTNAHLHRSHSDQFVKHR